MNEAAYDSNNNAAGHYEPVLTTVFLARCAGCGHKHPHAYMPPLDRDTCPSCNSPSALPGQPNEVEAVLTTGAGSRLADLCFALGRGLNRLKRRLDR